MGTYSSLLRLRKGEALGLQELEQSELDRDEKSRYSGAQLLLSKPPRLKIDEGDRKVAPKGLETLSSIQTLQ